MPQRPPSCRCGSRLFLHCPHFIVHTYRRSVPIGHTCSISVPTAHVLHVLVVQSHPLNVPVAHTSPSVSPWFAYVLTCAPTAHKSIQRPPRCLCNSHTVPISRVHMCPQCPPLLSSMSHGGRSHPLHQRRLCLCPLSARSKPFSRSMGSSGPG